jgi:hypothetical protein
LTDDAVLAMARDDPDHPPAEDVPGVPVAELWQVPLDASLAAWLREQPRPTEVILDLLRQKRAADHDAAA